MRQQEYQRLTRARSRAGFAVLFVSRSSLWLGKDHLLCIDSGGYSESYKRFYFRDIQAISILRTDRHQWWNAILGFIVFVFFIFAIGVAPKTPFARWSDGQIAGEAVLGGVMGLCLLLLLVNFLLGPACNCFLRTAVQSEELSSLNRVRRARKALERIRSLIVAVQGEVAPEEIAARMRDSVQNSEFNVQSSEPTGAVEPQP
jgi:hypothetical protein